jgi:hypothetical protein
VEVLWNILILLTGGMAWLVGQWIPVHVERLISNPCSLEEADHVIVRHAHGAEFVEEIKTETVRTCAKPVCFVRAVMFVVRACL